MPETRRPSPRTTPTAKPADSPEAPAIRLVNRIVAGAVAARASDIHLESEEAGVAVLYRVDGVLCPKTTLSRDVGVPVLSRIKIMAALDIADRMRPQDGRATVTIDERRIDLRVSTLPATHGEKVVVRILDARSTVLSLDTLGFTPHDAARIERLLQQREGLVLMTGPTGSGKTTTLYAMLHRIQSRGVNIITVEDPVEYRMRGIVQVQVNEKAGLNFAAALRSILRQDPDVVLVGEIRDAETAMTAVQASLTGHLVLSTVHTIDAPGAVARLADIGVERFKIAAALRGVVAQRLVRKLCESCRTSWSGSMPPSVEPLFPADVRLYGAGACPRCANTGFRGRIAVTEVLIAESDVERAITGGAGLAQLGEAARANGMRSLWESGVEHCVAGSTTIDELLRVLDPPTVARASASAHVPVRLVGGTGVTEIKVGVVDLYVIRPTAPEWRVLVVQRALDTRCPGAWETVHGRIEGDERPEEAAVRELAEETGLTLERLYNVTVQPFYLHNMKAVQMAVVFACFVKEPGDITLGAEHQRAEWVTVGEALGRFAWPREREALLQIVHLLKAGNAGPVEDVLRVY